MAASNSDYTSQLDAFEQEIVSYLRTFESIHENLLLGQVRESQAQLVQTAGDMFRRFERDFAPLEPADAVKDFHAKFVEAMAEISKSYGLFLSAPDSQWTLAFLYSRRTLCRGLYVLYDLRAHLPRLDAHWTLPGFTSPDRAAHGGDDHAPVGFIHKEPTDDRSGYTLYVPENYAPSSKWPVIVCLHGGYGQGFEYIFTWLRPARSKGYIVLAPKSLDVTWTMTFPSPDTDSILAMLGEVTGTYEIDRSRMYLSGLSDGGIFTYMLGLEHHELFTGIAPVAGAVHPMLYSILSQGRGKEMPMLVVHGARDFIFPVQITRQTVEMLTDLGCNLKYVELAEWGHAFPYSINERLVLPWFESLPPKSGTQSGS
jgi:phospholipase/carboxylesterase